jgi:hypothetical protein
MGQVVFKAVEKKIEVIGGWSPLEKEFFLYLFNLDEGNNRVLWSNLVDFDSIDQISTSRLQSRLSLYQIKAPFGFWELVELRQADNIRHEWDGTQWYKGLTRASSDDVPLAFSV